MTQKKPDASRRPALLYSYHRADAAVDHVRQLCPVIYGKLHCLEQLFHRNSIPINRIAVLSVKQTHELPNRPTVSFPEGMDIIQFCKVICAFLRQFRLFQARKIILCSKLGQQSFQFFRYLSICEESGFPFLDILPAKVSGKWVNIAKQVSMYRAELMGSKPAAYRIGEHFALPDRRYIRFQSFQLLWITYAKTVDQYRAVPVTIF